MQIPIELADCYQELFNLMSYEHGLTLTTSEMDEIIQTCLKTVQRIDDLGFTKVAHHIKGEGNKLENLTIISK